jgi:hypothetical protein
MGVILWQVVEVGHGVVMRAMPVDPRDQQWENDRPAYRVYFWQSTGSGAGSGWQSDEWELTETDVDEVLAWGGRRAGGRTMSVWVVHRDARGVGLIRLAGIDPTADREAWPSWASPQPG